MLDGGRKLNRPTLLPRILRRVPRRAPPPDIPERVQLVAAGAHDAVHVQARGNGDGAEAGLAGAGEIGDGEVRENHVLQLEAEVVPARVALARDAVAALQLALRALRAEPPLRLRGAARPQPQLRAYLALADERAAQLRFQVAHARCGDCVIARPAGGGG